MVTVVLNIPEETAQRAQVIAATTKRRVEDVLTEWLNRSAEIPVEELPDDEVHQLADMMLPEEQQDELDDLLDDQREGLLTETGRARLDMLMDIYRRALVRKSQAIRVAVERGLIPPLG